MKTCVICGKEFNGWGNNPAPVYKEGVCCTDCNLNVVIVARVRKYDEPTLIKLRKNLKDWRDKDEAR